MRRVKTQAFETLEVIAKLLKTRYAKTRRALHGALIADFAVGKTEGAKLLAQSSDTVYYMRLISPRVSPHGLLSQIASALEIKFYTRSFVKTFNEIVETFAHREHTILIVDDAQEYFKNHDLATVFKSLAESTEKLSYIFLGDVRLERAIRGKFHPITERIVSVRKLSRLAKKTVQSFMETFGLKGNPDEVYRVLKRKNYNTQNLEDL
ncbi:MAG: AAA family ATPase, partial [Desulfurobacteriaceae bacterium]